MWIFMLFLYWKILFHTTFIKIKKYILPAFIQVKTKQLINWFGF